MTPKSLSETVALPNGVKMPAFGFGVYLSPVTLCESSCLTALRHGYQHIDTAQYYENESEVGRAVKSCGVPREELFLTTKIPTGLGSVQLTYESCVASVEKVDPAPTSRKAYVDLFLVHSPSIGPADRREMWLALEKLYAEGRARSIGVSNYGIRHFEEMREYASVWPHVNQIELHPWAQQKITVEYCKKNGILLQAYCPLVRNTKAEDPTINAIAAKHGVTTAQALIRYSLQKGWALLAKSDKEERIRSNADVFSFELDAEDMAVLDGLDEGDAGVIAWNALEDASKD